MGKRQHQKDKLYLTCTEWSNVYGGRRPETDSNNEINRKFRRQTFDQCSLTFQPFTHPYCNKDGYIFDLSNIVPFVKKFGKDPISGQKLDVKSLVKLNFCKDDEDNYQCPILRKKFTENSHIVAIRTTGNVYSFEAVEQLNLKVKNFRDLLTDESFTKNDLITIQEPLDTAKRDISNFYHIQQKLKWSTDEDETEDNKSITGGKANKLKTIDQITKATLDELSKNDLLQSAAKKTGIDELTNLNTNKTQKKVADKFNTASYSTGTVAASLTSTVMAIETNVQPAILTDEEILFKNVKGKGYVQIVTNEGQLNIELYCQNVPKTCYNFLQLVRKHYYDNTIFHRSIKNFMIQGGDPTATGHGGQSIWGKPFEDEIRTTLGHNERGILSMANSGKNTNKSQFFITFRSCKHLNGKHTVFGKVVGGRETLNLIEKIETDEKDRPVKDIRIMSINIFVDPFQKLIDEMSKERQLMVDGEKKLIEEQEKQKITKSSAIKYREGVGSFIDPSLFGDDLNGGVSAAATSFASSASVTSPKDKKIKGTSNFGDFSCW